MTHNRDELVSAAFDAALLIAQRFAYWFPRWERGDLPGEVWLALVARA